MLFLLIGRALIDRLVEDAMSGKYLDSNFSLPCPPGLDIPPEIISPFTSNNLKVNCARPRPTAYMFIMSGLSSLSLWKATAAIFSGCHLFSHKRREQNFVHFLKSKNSLSKCFHKNQAVWMNWIHFIKSLHITYTSKIKFPVVLTLGCSHLSKFQVHGRVQMWAYHAHKKCT